MTRIIKASEVKLGMEIEWSKDGVLHRLTPNNIVTFKSNDNIFVPDSHRVTGYNFCAVGGGVQWVSADQEITVLSETAPAQPAEPTAFGARVVADGHEFLLSHGGRRSWKARLDGKRYAWTDLCDMGSVVVIDATPSWTVPETPEVPGRIVEWPEDDEHLRAYSWRDHDGDTWGWLNDEAEWECRSSVDIRLGTSRRPDSGYGPWTRITDS